VMRGGSVDVLVVYHGGQNQLQIATVSDVTSEQ